MDSPLTRQERPNAFEPKIVELYRNLFPVLVNHDFEEFEPSEGFWREFFLLKPDKTSLFNILDPLTGEDLLHLQSHTRLFFRRAIQEAGSGVSPRNENALDNLTAFLSAVLSKRYANPSTDVIEVLAGLDTIDRRVSDLVQGLEIIIRQSPQLSFRRKAVDTALAMVSGSYQTSLVTYFMHRDLFPACMKYIQDSADPIPGVVVLLGLLANYNKFESTNIYQNRLEDFVNEEIIQKITASLAQIYQSIRNDYVAIQDDFPAPWSIASTLQMVGLRSLTAEAAKPVPPTAEEAKQLFGSLPPPNAAVILSTYSFVHANKIFASHLISTSKHHDSAEPPMSAFLSATSYLCHHAHRSIRAGHYAVLSLLTTRLLIEDSVIVKRICSSDEKTSIRLSRQRTPHLPLISHPRIPATAILDICTDALSHNLRKRLTVPLYNLTLALLHGLLAHLESTKTRLQHHWSYIWGSLFSLLKFLTQYSADLTAAPSQAVQIRTEICTPLVSILAFCLSRGDNFLPDPSSYDDLFYKLIENTSTIQKFQDIFCPVTKTKSSKLESSTSPNILTAATTALLSVVSHYQELLSTSKQKHHQSPMAIQKIIKEGQETLPDMTLTAAANGDDGNNIRTTSTRGLDFGYHTKWKESEWKAEIKRILRTVTEDARLVAVQSGI